MIALLQRVQSAGVSVDGVDVGTIGAGLLILVCAVKGDTEQKARELAVRVLRYRIFEDEAGKMNKSVTDVAGDILVVSQFTLYADCRKGRRPGFTEAARGDTAIKMYDQFNEALRQRGFHVETGIFGADMKIELLNDGPVTIWLDSDVIM